MYPLPVARGGGELIDSLLCDSDPIGDAKLPAREFLQLTGRFDREHLNTPARNNRAADRQRRIGCPWPDRSSPLSRSPTSRTGAVGLRRARALSIRCRRRPARLPPPPIG